MSYHRFQSERARRRQFATTQPQNADGLSYAGELADTYVAPAIKAGETLANNWVSQMDGLSSKAQITGAVVTDPVQAASCNFDTSQDNVSLTERTLTLSDLQVNEQLCRGTILPTWHAVRGTRNSDWAVDEFRNFVLGEIAAKTAESVETLIWQGGTVMDQGFLSNDGTLDADGLTNSSLAGATTQDITAITANNVINGFGLVHQKAATDKSAIMAKPDLNFYVSPKTFALYQQALATAGGALTSAASDDSVTYGNGQGVNNASVNQNLSTLTYLGTPIRRCPGMFDDAILLTTQSNLFVGSNLRTDYTQVQYIPVYQYDGSDNVRVVMRFGLGTQSGVPTDAVLGKTY